MSVDHFTLLCFSVLFFVLFVLRTVQGFRRLPLPPGPPAWPVIGNALQMPTDRAWVTFSRWAAKYGPIMHLSVFGSSMIVLSSPEVIRELLERRSDLYSDRPRMIMIGDMVGYTGGLVLCPYGDVHKEGRKLMLSALGIRKLSAIHRIQELKGLEFLSRILKTPKQFKNHVRWLIASVVFEITHGHQVHDLNDPLLQLAEQCNRDFSEAAAPGAFLVDTFPILRYVPAWFPGANFKHKARKWRNTAKTARDQAYDAVRDQLAHGIAQPSFTAELIEQDPSPSPGVDEQYRQLTFTFYSAGADTTVSAIESFFLAMSLYPHVQKRAQDEIDAIVGRENLPRFADRSKLPYVDAIMKEVHRWNPVGPLALPHRVRQDDVFEGYRIPAGATIVANSWAVMHTASIYPDPFEFNPDRYFTKDIEFGMNPDPRMFAFGYGKRSCPGQSLAEDSLFLVIATVLAAFNITKALDASGKPIEPEVHYSGVICHAGPFDCTLTPRSPQIAQMIADALACET